MKRIAGLCLILIATGAAYGEEDGSSATYKAIELRRFGMLEGKLDGTIHRISKGVDMTLVADRADGNIEVQSTTVEFFYENKEKRAPSRIVFAGNVTFKHSQGIVHADKAEVDFEAGEAVFTGNPTVDNDQIRGVEAEYIMLDLNTQNFVMGPGKIKEIRLSE